MVPIRTLLVDDEPLARENLRIRLRPHEDFQVVGECATGREAVAAIGELKPDVVFLDIRMPDLDGFEVLEEVPPELSPVVVFVTAYDRYALEAFRVHALDYLLKPIEEERFSESLQICRQRIAESRRAGEEGEHLFHVSGAPGEGSDHPASARPRRDRLIIRGRGRIFFLKSTSLHWIEAYGDYVRVHVGDKSYLLRKTMNEMEARMDPQTFVRISRSAIVNLDQVQDLEPVSRGEYQVRLAGGRELKLTRTYRERLETLLGDRF